MPQTIQLQVQEDFIDRLAVARPVQALSELIWNAFDADAKDVRVEFDRDASGLLRGIRVRDDGYGISREDAPDFFMRLGGSWKRERRRTRFENRALHGEEGKGRFRALALGRVVDWHITVPSNGRPDSPLIRYTISIIRDRPREALISDAQPANDQARRGVEVEISELFRQWQLEDNAEVLNELTGIVALYLTDYKHVRLSFGGLRVDAESEIAERRTFQMTPIKAEGSPWVVLDVIEWKTERDRDLHLCNESGFPLSRLPANIVAPGFSFAAYLKSPFITQLNEQNLLDISGMVPALNAAVDEARVKLRDHFRARASDKVKDIVQIWKAEDVYPFEHDPQTSMEAAQRQVFDVVAVSVAAALPEIQTGEQRSRKFQLRMLRQAIERSPEDLQIIFNEVLQLPQRKREDLAQLLQRTPLVKIINAAKLVADRLEFLGGLESMLFTPALRATFRERRQLHRILATNTWIFGEEYALTVNDRSLTEVLRKHRDKAGMNALVDNEPVLRPEGGTTARRKGIVDLVLSRRIPTADPADLHHLVIELKAPKKHLGPADTQQIKSYAYAVIRDERFGGANAKWDFWLVGNELTDHVRHELNNTNGPGILQRTGDRNLVIAVRQWGDLINEAKARLQFVQKELNFEVDRDDSLKTFREIYASILGEPEVSDALPFDVNDDEAEDDEQ